MPVAPSGFVSLAVDRLRQTIASSTTFQAWVGVGTPALALPKLFVVQAPAGTSLPYAVFEVPNNHVERRLTRARYDNNLFEGEASIQVRFRGAITGGDTDQDSFYRQENTVDGICADIMALVGTILYDGSLAFPLARFDLVRSPKRPEEDEAKTKGDFYEDAIRFTYIAPWP